MKVLVTRCSSVPEIALTVFDTGLTQNGGGGGLKPCALQVVQALFIKKIIETCTFYMDKFVKKIIVKRKSGVLSKCRIERQSPPPPPPPHRIDAALAINMAATFALRVFD